jgi:hypothetical protein
METVSTNPNINYITASSPQQLDITKWSMEFEFEEFENRLRGNMLVKDEALGTKKWVKDPNKQPRLNEQGISWLVFMLKPILNPNTFQSNISEERANHIGESTCYELLDGLYQNQRKFDMGSEDYNTIMSMVENIIQFAVTRPIDGEERRLMHESRQVSEVITNQPPAQQKQGGLPSLSKIFGGH